ncbi:MAG: sarcosine oxidase subunit gamma [Actinobacteria bacterium]|nr:sarcosine oxidase subunit gamma [Actinomycetota bacterium]
MAEAPRRESPLRSFFDRRRMAVAPARPGVTLTERPFLGHLNLRGDPAAPAFARAVAAATGLALPLAPNTVQDSNGLAALWLGPDEWLILTPVDGEHAVAERLRGALGDLHASVTDASSGQTVLTVRGPSAWDVLAKGCRLDLHPRSSRPGTCAQTLVAKAATLIWPREPMPEFDLIVRRSSADYLARWLEDAAQEFGVQIDAPPEVHRP